MDTRSLLRTMSAYHPWAYSRLFSAVELMAEGDYRHDFGLAFRSVHGTLNHLLVAETIWHERLLQASTPSLRLDQEVEHGREALKSSLMSTAESWAAVLDEFDTTRLGTELRYQNMQGIELSFPAAPLILHVFNHATHHRGQISAVLTRLGFQAPEMDLTYFLLEHTEATASG